MKIHIATSRPIGERCIQWAKEQGYELTSMEECEIFISVLYDTLITQHFINSKAGCFNFHPGILPEYRGSGAYSWVIINEEKVTGVTLHQIERSIDGGGIIDMQAFEIKPNDTAESLFRQAEELISQMFKHWLPKLIASDFKLMFNMGGKIYYRKDLEKAKDLTRFIRAFTFEGKENAYYINAKGEKIYLKL